MPHQEAPQAQRGRDCLDHIAAVRLDHTSSSNAAMSNLLENETVDSSRTKRRLTDCPTNDRLVEYIPGFSGRDQTAIHVHHPVVLRYHISDNVPTLEATPSP